MPRGKQSNSESSNLPHEEASVEGELKTKNAVKVTLVKPLQASELMSTDEMKTNDIVEIPAENGSSIIVSGVTQPRPKVGRPSSARKKKSGEAGLEKKPRKPRKKAASAAASQMETAVETPAVEMKELPVAPAEVAPALGILAMEVMPQEEAVLPTESLGLPADWNPEPHSRPQSFKSILFAVILFVLINLGFMTLFSASHKSKAPADATKAETTLPAIPSADSAVIPPPPASAAPAPGAEASLPQVSAPVTAPQDNGAPAPAAQAPSEMPQAKSSEAGVLASPIAAAPFAAPAAPVVLPGAAPVTAVTETPLPAVTTSAAPAAVPAPSVAASAAPAPASSGNKVDKAATAQELLSILDKN